MKLVAPLEIGLACADIERMSAFYMSIFGLVEVSRISVAVVPERKTSLSEGGYTVIRLQSPFGERLKLLSPDDGPAPPVDMPETDIIGRRNRVFLTLIVDDMEMALSRVTEAGGISMDTPTEIRPGLRIAFAKDPEGNLIEITHYTSVTDYRNDL